jgi:4'-phosphopantetheinyl transferase
MLGNEKLWSCIVSGSCPLPSGVQVWAGWLDLTGDGASGIWSTLSSQERERAGRFAFERDRARFIAARGLLREILGSCLGAEPGGLEFAYSAKGKPSLGGGFASSGLEFNLAHSGSLAVFAVARHGVVGVDVERIRAIPDLSALGQRFFSHREYAEMRKLSDEDAVRRFFRIWTRKEAWLKATGEGISGLPSSIEVFGPLAEDSLCGGPQESSCGTRLCLHALAPAPGYLGALAVTPP